MEVAFDDVNETGIGKRDEKYPTGMVQACVGQSSPSQDQTITARLYYDGCVLGLDSSFVILFQIYEFRIIEIYRT